MQTRSSVLGKRHAPSESSSSLASSTTSQPCDVALPPTPEQSPNPKRMRYSGTIMDGDGNKENIPPFRVTAINSPMATRTRSLRRSSTEHLSPSRTRSTPRRHASVSGILPATPATIFSGLVLATPPPSPHSSIQPISTRVRALLRPTCNHVGRMAGRQNERDVIARFISGFISTSDCKSAKASDASILYISGSPGTGKTALVNAILGDMREQLSVAQVSVIAVNCMAVNDIDALYDKLVEDLGKQSTQVKKAGRGRKPKETSLKAVCRLLDEQSAKCVVLLDEIDHIASSSQALMSLFNLAITHSSSLRFIGVANTHTLSSSSSATSASIEALAGVQTMHFSPYTPAQLQEIVQGRLMPLKESATSESLDEFLPPATLMLLTKKVAALTGDVRAVFEVLRGAIGIAIKSSTVDSSSAGANPLELSTPPVTPAHILSALKAYNPASNIKAAAGSPVVTKKASDSEAIVKVRELGLQARLVLLSMVLARRRLDTGLSIGNTSSPSQSSVPRTPSKRSHNMADVSGSAVDASQLHGYYKTILGRSDSGVFNPVSRSEFGDLLGMLETVGLLELSSATSLPTTPSKSGKRGLARSVSFGAARIVGPASTQEVKFVEGVRIDEVCRGLGIHDNGAAAAASDLMEEEVRGIYEKERVRIARAKSITASIADVFDHAVAP